MGAFHEMNHLELIRPITKWCATAYEAQRISEYIEIAFRHATRGMPGPTFVDFPQNLLETEVTSPDMVNPVRSQNASGPWGSPHLVAQTVDLLKKAQRPLIVYGSGIIWSGAHDVLHKFVEKAGIPAVPTPLARGCIPDDHPLSCFISRSRAMAQADVVLFMGAKLNFILSYGRPPRFNPQARTIQVDVAPEEIGRNRPIDVGIVGDAKAVLTQLLEAWKQPDKPLKSSWPESLKEVENRSLT
jgi:acetolactate synthase-1/2/3 large subunit